MVKSSKNQRAKSADSEAWTEHSSCPLDSANNTKRRVRHGATYMEQRRVAEKIRREKIRRENALKPQNESGARLGGEAERHKKYRTEKKKLAAQVEKNAANLSNEVSALKK